MSKWTLEKILACEEIKFGTMFSPEGIQEEIRVFLDKNISTFTSYKPNNQIVFTWDKFRDYSNFKFFRPDGTEILPPKGKKKIKRGFWVRVYNSGFGTVTYKTEDEAIDLSGDAIGCEYFEREIEVDDE